MLQSTGYKTKKATQKNTYIYTYTSNHIQIIKMSTILILGWKSFAVNDCLYTGAHGHHQILEMFCQVFNAATLGCCLFVGLSAFSLVFSNWKACSIGFRSGEWLGHWRIFHFINGQVMAMSFEVCLGSLSICIVKLCPINFVHLADCE